MWYSPESDADVHFGCEPPGPGWREEPFFEAVGADIDGLLRGPAGVFTDPTADTGLLGPLPPLGPAGVGDTSPIPFGPTADTGFLDTADTSETGFLDTADTARPSPPRPPAGSDTAEPDASVGDTLALVDTGEFVEDDTADVLDTFIEDTNLTADTGFLPPESAPFGDTVDTGVE